MSALSAALTAALLTTPIVEVTPTHIVETPRQVVHNINPSASDIGIDDRALNAFLARAAERYEGTE